jgi:hypothetical protein
MFIVGLVSGVMLATAASAFAASETVQATFERFVLVVNGGEPQEIEPLTYKGTTYLPVRETANRLGYDVTYKADGKTIILNQTKKDVGSVSTLDNVNVINETDTAPIVDPQVIDVDPNEWVSNWELNKTYDFQFQVGIPDGADPTSDTRQIKLVYGDKSESWIIPKVIVGDLLVTNENGNDLILKNGMRYIRRSFAEQFFNQ